MPSAPVLIPFGTHPPLTRAAATGGLVGNPRPVTARALPARSGSDLGRDPR